MIRVSSDCDPSLDMPSTSVLETMVTSVLNGKSIDDGEDIELKLILGKQLSNKIYLNTQFNLDNIENSEYEATYRLNQNTSIVGGLDEKNLWHLGYRIKFYY